MKFTNKIISKTNNKVLKVVLTNMKDQIQKGVKDGVAYEEQQTKRSVSEFGKDMIELALLVDLVKSISSYTMDSDEVKSFTSSYSIKGNFEMYGVVVRGGVEHNFRTEVIIADGMINRRHLRYITKTSLPKANNLDEVTKIKDSIKSRNKVQRIQEYIDTLELYKSNAQNKVDLYGSYSDQEWIDEVIQKSSWKMVTEVFEDFSKERLEGCVFSTKEEFNKWKKEVNERRLESAKEDIEMKELRVRQLNKSLAKEYIKLDKAKALVV
jgi:hypothetical protein